MELTIVQASEIFQQLPARVRIPSAHPAYVAADAAELQDARPRYYGVQAGDNLFYHAAIERPVPGQDAVDFQSPYGYGGPILSGSPSFFQSAWDHYATWCRQNHVLVEFVRFHPLVDNWRPYPGEAAFNRETVWIDLLAEDLLKAFKTRARTAVRKAVKKGLAVSWRAGNALVSHFAALYRETMARLDADDAYFFSDRYFSALSAMPGFQLCTCWLEGRIVAGAIFLTAGTFMEYHLSASTEEGRRLGATNLILKEAAHWGKANGFQKLHLGGGSDTRPDNRLLFFKKGFSNNTSNFYIGSFVHNPPLYRRMAQGNDDISRILFYR
jgi:hypothetical protein